MKTPKGKDSSTPGSRNGSRFRYIDENVLFEKDPRLQYRRYDEGQEVGEDIWGAKAARDLAVVSGDRFKHEKTKKKRGSNRGFGKLDSGKVNSVIFDSSED